MKLRLSLFIVFVTSAIGCNENPFKLDDPNDLKLEDVITLDVEEESISADGISTVKVTAHLNGDTPDAQNITLKTDNGTFTGEEPSSSNNNSTEMTIKAASRQIQAFLKSSTEVGEVTISATVGDYVTYTTVNFTRENPSRLFLESNATTLQANGNDSITLTANLIAPQNENGQVGTVSKDTRILFTARLDSTGAVLTSLRREALSNSTGVATSSLVGRTSGLVRIIASVENLPQVRDSILVEFTN